MMLASEKRAIARAGPGVERSGREDQRANGRGDGGAGWWRGMRGHSLTSHTASDVKDLLSRAKRHLSREIVLVTGELRLRQRQRSARVRSVYSTRSIRHYLRTEAVKPSPLKKREKWKEVDHPYCEGKRRRSEPESARSRQNARASDPSATTGQGRHAGAGAKDE